MSEVSDAIWGVFQSASVCDSNLEAANVVDAIAKVAYTLNAIEHAIRVHAEAMDRRTSAIQRLADHQDLDA